MNARPVHISAARGEETLISIRDVCKTYEDRQFGDTQALDGVSLDIAPGEFVSLLGPSGCGKSTLLMLVAGLYSRTGGSITIAGEPVARPRTDVGIVFQRPVLLGWRSALDNVLIQIEARGLAKSDYRDRALELLDAVGLRGFEHALPHSLSGGMQQRVSICRALIHDPPLLLMDEPFAALDALTRQQLVLDLQSLWLNSGKTVLFVTHSIPEAVFQSDRVVVLSPRPGRIDRIWDVDLSRPRRLQVETSEKFSQYAHEITELFKSRGVIRERPTSEENRNGFSAAG